MTTPSDAQPVAPDLRTLVPGFRLDWSGLRNTLEDFVLLVKKQPTYELRSAHLDEMARQFEDAVTAALDAANQRTDTERQKREAAEREVEYNAEASGISREYADHLLARALVAEASLAKANARIAELEAGWQPIETAPTNQAILIHLPHSYYYGNGGVYAGMLVDLGSGRRWMTFGWSIGRDCEEPDGWMPMPSAALTNIEKERDDGR